MQGDLPDRDRIHALPRLSKACGLLILQNFQKHSCDIKTSPSIHLRQEKKLVAARLNAAETLTLLIQATVLAQPVNSLLSLILARQSERCAAGVVPAVD